MILQSFKTLHGDSATVEDINYHGYGKRRMIRINRTQDAQSISPPIDGYYYDAVKLVYPGSIMILGVAGGSAAMVAEHVGYRQIFGIENDPMMIEVGKRWFGLESIFTQLELGDCFNFEVWSNFGFYRKYSCIFFDAFRERQGSSKLYDLVYLRFLMSRLDEGGTLIINALTFNSSRNLSAALEMADLNVNFRWQQFRLNWVCFIQRKSEKE